MVLRRLQWIVVAKLLCLCLCIEAQIERSYDTNDWIPVTPTSNDSTDEESAKNVAGRVLNLERPSQKFFPEHDYDYKRRRPNTEQSRQNGRQKARHQKEYKFEIPAASPKDTQRPHYFADQEVRLSTNEQPSLINQEQLNLNQEQIPKINTANGYQQYNTPFNNSFYQPLAPTFINQNDNQNSPQVITTPSLKEDKEVQLLYVPLENLKPNQPITQDSHTVFRHVEAPVEQKQLFAQNAPQRISDIEQDLIQQTVQAHMLEQQIHLGQPLLLQTTTTPKEPKKRKPHQPPLSVYMEGNADADISDVLDALRDVSTIAVHDKFTPESPKIFIGPSALTPPPEYTKFPIPYINKLDGNRVERKIDNLPFFVAPQSYKAPPGYSKISLPPPHVGSIVVSNKEESHKRSASKPTSFNQNQINDYQVPKQTYTIPVTDKAVEENTQGYFNSQTYYNTNPLRDIQEPQYLQFSINDNLNQFVVPTKTPLDIINQPLRNENIPGISNTNPEKSQSNQQLSTGANTSDLKISQNPSPEQTTPEISSNPYSTPIESIEQEHIQNIEKHKQQSFIDYKNTKDFIKASMPSGTKQYPYNDDFYSGISSFEIPTDLFSSKYNQPSFPGENTNPYDIPIKSSHRDRYLSNVNANAYDIPSRNTQRERQPTEESFHRYNIPTKNTQAPSQYNQQSSTLNLPSDEYAQAPIVSITPKTTTPSLIKETEKTVDEYPSSTHGTTDKRIKQKPTVNPLELAINQYELHQINSQLGQEKPDITKDPYDFRYHLDEVKEPERSEQLDIKSNFKVEKSKVKGHYDYSSQSDVETKSPKYDFNSQYDRYTSTPATILRDIFIEEKTTVKPTTKTRRRGKPTRQPVRTTTEDPTEKEAYTVLEEFSVRNPTTPSYSEPPKDNKYLPDYTAPAREEVPDVPANVYRIRTTTPNYVNIKVKSTTPQAHIEDTPINEYNLNINQNSAAYAGAGPNNQDVLNQDQPQIQQNIFTLDENTPFDPNSAPQGHLNQNSYIQPQDEKSNIATFSQIGGQNQQENEYKFQQNNAAIPDYVNNLQDQSVRTLLVPNLLIPTTKQQPSTVKYEPPIEQITLATTTTTTTTTTTEKPTEVTTVHARNRSRQRGGSRFTTPSTYSAPSSARRAAANRRRPVHPSRTTTESPKVTTDYTPREDFKRITTRQRPRTRGRPVQNTVTERISTTENEIRPYNEPTSEAIFEVPSTPKLPQSYIQFDHTIEDQKIIINQDDDSKEYQAYGLQPQNSITESPRVVLQYDNTATTQRPTADIEITHPILNTEKQPEIFRTTEAQIHVQSGGVLYNNKKEASSRQTVRSRGRARGRGRATTTTERPTTSKRIITTTTTTTTTRTPSSKEDIEEEFYGFIRQPNFNQIHNIQIASATQQPLHIYQSLPSKTETNLPNLYPNSNNAATKQNIRPQLYQNPQGPTGLSDVRINFNSEPIDTTTVHFVGQIRPKYRSTTQNYEPVVTTTEQRLQQVTETPKPRKRPRIRLSQKKTPTNHRQLYNEVSTPKAEQATKRSNVIRSRGRGTVQYRLPENLKQKKDSEADVEGGNYPSFFQNKQPVTTELPSFQISVDPTLEEDDEGDQLPYSSISRPKILPRPDEWTEATDSSVTIETYVPANQIVDEGKILPKAKETTPSEVEATEEPTALQLVGSLEQAEESSEETYRENTKAVEELFKEVNERSKIEATTTENSRKKKGRRRGVWKLVKQKPVDNFETAESQNYYAVVNSFENIVKVNGKVNRFDDAEKGSSVNYQAYNNFNPVLEKNSDSYDYELQKINVSTTEQPEPQEQYSESNGAESETTNAVDNKETTTEEPDYHTKSENDVDIETGTTTTTTPTTTKGNGIFDAIYEMFGTDTKAEEAIPSTTNQETILVTTTTVSPTFPQEMTEVPATTFPDDFINSTTTENVNTEYFQTTTSAKLEVTRTFEVEPWEMKAIRTSTSTEISLQTEICYKGRCIKSADQKVRS